MYDARARNVVFISINVFKTLVNVAFGVHLAEKILEIVNGLI